MGYEGRLLLTKEKMSQDINDRLLIILLISFNFKCIGNTCHPLSTTHHSSLEGSNEAEQLLKQHNCGSIPLNLALLCLSWGKSEPTERVRGSRIKLSI